MASAANYPHPHKAKPATTDGNHIRKLAPTRVAGHTVRKANLQNQAEQGGKVRGKPVRFHAPHTAVTAETANPDSVKHGANNTTDGVQNDDATRNSIHVHSLSITRCPKCEKYGLEERREDATHTVWCNHCHFLPKHLQHAARSRQ